MSGIFHYGETLKPKARRGNEQRIQFIRYLTSRERASRQRYGSIEFFGLTVKGAATPLGHKKVGSLEYFDERGWMLDDT
jgi:hypothetical protein